MEATDFVVGDYDPDYDGGECPGARNRQRVPLIVREKWARRMARRMQLAGASRANGPLGLSKKSRKRKRIGIAREALGPPATQQVIECCLHTQALDTGVPLETGLPIRHAPIPESPLEYLVTLGPA
jgi:hypothetical protein